MQGKTDEIDPLQPLTHLLWRLMNFLQLLIGNAIVQEPFLQGIGDQADFLWWPTTRVSPLSSVTLSSTSNCRGCGESAARPDSPRPR